LIEFRQTEAWPGGVSQKNFNNFDKRRRDGIIGAALSASRADGAKRLSGTSSRA